MLRRSKTGLVAGLAGLAAAACTSAAGGPAEPELPFAPTDRLPAVERWDVDGGWRQLPRSAVGTPAERWRIPVSASGYTVADGVIAIVEQVADFLAVRRIDAGTGAELWSTPVPGLTNPASLEIEGGGSLITVDGQGQTGTAAVLNAADGRVIWHGPPGERLPLVSAIDDMVIVAAATGTRGIERATGALRWQTADFLEVSGRTLVRDDVAAGVVGVVDPITGTPIWQRPREDFSDPHAVGDTFLITRDEDGQQDSVTALDLATGAQRWRVELPNLGRTTVTALDDETVLVAGGDLQASGAAVLALSTGAVRWRPQGDRRVLRVDGQPYVLAERGDLTTVFTGTSGDQVGSARLPAAQASSYAGGTVYRATGTEVVAVRLPDLVGQWRVPVSTHADAVPHPVPGGFVIESSTNSAPALVAYLE